MILVELRYVLDDSQGTHKVGCALDHSILWPPRHDTDPSIRPEIPSLQNPGTHTETRLSIWVHPGISFSLDIMCHIDHKRYKEENSVNATGYYERLRLEERSPFPQSGALAIVASYQRYKVKA
jgi:hypothetical protein